MELSQNGLDFIKNNEGLNLKAYKCPADVWTIGYGWTKDVDGVKIKEGLTITESKAEELLKNGIKEYEKYINNFVKVKLTQNQFDALVDFVYNIGPTHFSSSTLLKLLNEGKYDEAANQFSVWNKAGGVVVKGIVSRRERTKQLFLKK